MKKFFLALFLTSIVTISIAAKTFTVGVENINYYPYYSTENDAYIGFSREVLDMFSQDNNHTFIYKSLPIKRLYGEFINGAVDFKYPDNSDWASDKKSDKKIFYSSPIIEIIDALMVKPSNIDKSVDAIKKIGTVRGFTPYGYLDLIEIKKIKLIENNSLKGLLDQAIIGRIDGAYVNIVVAKHILNTQFKNDLALIYSSNLPKAKSNFHISTINFPEILKEFNEWLIKNNDKITRLKQKYKLK